MWFRIRTGFVSVPEPMEICVAKYDERESGTAPEHFSIYARPLDRGSLDYSGILGKANVHAGRTVHLARFVFSDTAASEIAACMISIGDAIATEAKVCDLSVAGQPAAWAKDWNLIDWSNL